MLKKNVLKYKIYFPKKWKKNLCAKIALKIAKEWREVALDL